MGMEEEGGNSDSATGPIGFGEGALNKRPDGTYEGMFLQFNFKCLDFDKTLSANVALTDQPNTVALIWLEISGSGAFSANYKGTLSYGGITQNAELKIPCIGPLGVGKLWTTNFGPKSGG